MFKKNAFHVDLYLKNGVLLHTTIVVTGLKNTIVLEG